MTLDTKLSPMMAQWAACKEKAKDAILLFRLGDFYEAFEQDAVILSKELDIVLTKRQETPMAGLPAHSAENYIDRLVAKGFCIAIAEQMESPDSAKGLVRREIVRTVTPGTLIQSSLLPEKSSNFIVAITKLGPLFGISVLDYTTADFRVFECEGEKAVLDELFRLCPKELLIQDKTYRLLSPSIEELKNCIKHIRHEHAFNHDSACALLFKHFHVYNLDGFGLKGMTAAINAAGALLEYVKYDLSLPINHIKTLKAENLSGYLALDTSTRRHLELVEPLHEKGETLLSLLDHTETPMGGRLLREWILHPLLSIDEIVKRQNIISLLLKKRESAQKLTAYLKPVRDLERLSMRMETGYASPRDFLALRLSLETLPALSEELTTLGLPSLPHLASLKALLEKITSSIVDHPPLRLTEGGIFKEGYHQELDELRLFQKKSATWVAEYQTTLREQTQIKTLKVGYTQAFGYYIEVSRGWAENMPSSFQRRQTLVNAERFISPELKEFEYKILNAEQRILSLETELFLTLRKEIAQSADILRLNAKTLARLDVFLSLALVAHKYNYARPEITEENILQIEEGRHPVIEASLKAESFIPNDLTLDENKERLLIITGPNMAGKSTYIRQVALIVILAQIGSYIPAKKGLIGIVDKLFSRIGASDDLSRGQSTFMVEMSETASILHGATSRSLVILDEIGRGTSTYDGIAIAWAVAHFLLTQKDKRAKTLFATHYWELTKLEEEESGAINYHIAVHEGEEGIVFLRKIVRGGTDKSYGIHVAKLAGLPLPVIKKAEEMLASLHKNSVKVTIKPKKDIQLELF